MQSKPPFSREIRQFAVSLSDIGESMLLWCVRVGPAVVGVRPGDLVATRVRRPCEQARCPACAMGRPDFCVTGDFTERGINKRHGLRKRP